MAGLKYYERTKLLIELIEKKKTGGPSDLARNIGVPKRMVYLIIDHLRLSLGKDISYSKDKKVTFLSKILPRVKDYFTDTVINLIIN
ncbi:hypothetical protein [Mongoliitalea lutea]|uniref:Uncharacterized protein n=1 Tax=Mongoliitalea lutea TaxID=849756 RepID=A0A8J3CYY1_9BACT|nr:hypothetical protein [Mongoliitalea lutea]GHB37475.1 hypothetical protein GCM10008106_18370 [Mongoliitalea lutea]